MCIDQIENDEAYRELLENLAALAESDEMMRRRIRGAGAELRSFQAREDESARVQ